jgi:predicted ATPase/DNA-binding CsgD family transcriptional regulator
MTDLHTPQDRMPAGNLPLEPNSFIGREADIDELAQLLVATRIVTLCGTGGIGKTRLAVRVGARLLPAFPGGVWLVELADVASPREVAGRVATALGILPEGGRPLEETLLHVLAGRDLLLVLDNCEPVVDECARLCGRLLSVCPGVRVLATSREPLRVPGETAWRVPPLSLPPEGATGADIERCEAVRLFSARAADARSGFSLGGDAGADLGQVGQVGQVCRALDGLPLAIELAAAMTRVLSVGQIAERMADRFRLLSGGSRTAPARHQTLRAAVDWSYQLLTEPERLLLRRVTVFRSGWTLPVAEKVCAGDGVEPEDVLTHLCSLVDKSLVVVDGEVAGEARYRLLETIREYAAEQLAGSGEVTELRRRHRDYVLEMAEEFRMSIRPGGHVRWPGIQRQLDLLEGFKLDLFDAMGWSAAVGEVEQVLRMATSLRWVILGSGRFHGVVVKGLRQLLALDLDGVSPALLGQAHVLCGNLVLGRARIDDAREHGRAGLALCRQAGDSPGEAQALILLSLTEPDGSAERLDAATELARSVGDDLIEAETEGVRGTLALAGGRLREAGRAFERVLSLTQALDNRLGMSNALVGLAKTARRRRDFDAARRHYEEALGLLRTFDARQTIISCETGLGIVALEQGDHAEAGRRLTEALLLGRDAGLRRETARTLEFLASLASGEGDDHRAVRLAGASAALRESLGGPAGLGARFDAVVDLARHRLGEAVVTGLWAEGTAMTVDQAVTCALEQIPPADTRDAARPMGPMGNGAGPGTPNGRGNGGAAGPALPGSSLTNREQEIAQLIAAGLSNRAIAVELVISPGTAARHVANILAKLGFSSRAQVAAWVVERRAAER